MTCEKDPGTVSPDCAAHEQIQLDLFFSHRSNPPLYPSRQ
jgi:hypothetical protein